MIRVSPYGVWLKMLREWNASSCEVEPANQPPGASTRATSPISGSGWRTCSSTCLQ